MGSKQETPTTRNATFSDLNRRWAGLPQNQLENMVGAAVSTMVAAEDVSSHCAESNLVFAADEAIHEQRRNPSAGRTVQDAIDLEKQDENELASVPVKLSILQKPAQVDFDFETGDNHRKGKVRSAADPLEVPPMESLTKQNEKKASQAMRQYLDLKEKAGSLASELQSLKSSLEKHSTTREELQERRANIGASMMQNPVLEQIAEEEQNARRVIAQLERKIGELEQTHAKTKSEMEIARTNAYAHSRNAQSSARAYRDPISDALRLRPSFGLNVTNNNQILRSLESMRVGLPINQTPIRPLVCIGPSQSTGKQRKSLVVSRMSHAVTINTHLSYPVYCLRFDKTGRYFVTGADDFLSRVFCLGAKQTTDVSGKGRLPQGHLETIRGAVLVCTLRGHAGVINDIDVSSDNCFLATASEDGDVRVWALKDGAPVAILRGHAGGANMVSIAPRIVLVLRLT